MIGSENINPTGERSQCGQGEQPHFERQFYFRPTTTNDDYGYGLADVARDFDVLYLIAEVHFFAELRPWLFTSHAACWRELLQESPDTEALLRHASASLGFTFLFLALGFRRFRRREEGA